MSAVLLRATGNPDNVELRVAVALALIERADARVALSRQTVARPDDRTAAERDYSDAASLLTALRDAGEIEGTDIGTLDQTAKKLADLRAGR